MAVSFLFEINSNYWSTDAVTYDGHDYLKKIIPSSFEGITLKYNLDNSLIMPNDIDFELSDPTPALVRANLENQYCLITKLTDGVFDRAWKFKLQRAIYCEGKWFCHCINLLQEFLEGSWPNTPHPFELWPSSDTDLENLDDLCVPVIFGTAYIPILSVNTGSDRYYILGDDTSPTYTINEVQSPHEWNDAPTVYGSGSYAFNQSNDAGHKLAQFLIHNPSGDGSTYYNGLYPTGSGFYPILAKFSRDDTVDLTSPEEWIEYILEDFGIQSVDIDTGVGSTFAAAATIFSGRSITWNGGFWKKEDRETLLARLLRQCDCVLVVADKIELHPFSSTSVETIISTDMKKTSYSPAMLTKSKSDGGRVAWPKASSPQDVFSGKAIVPTYNAQASVLTPSKEVFIYQFDTDSQRAQRAGILDVAKKYLQEDRITFQTECSKITNINTLIPSNVVTINDALFGPSYGAVIESLQFKPDNSVAVSIVRLTYIEDWDDLSPDAVSITTDDSDGFGIPDVTQQNIHYITVGPNDGDAMFSNLEAALATLGASAAKIYIKNGTYILSEAFVFPSYDVEMIGESKNGVIIEISSDDNIFEKTVDTGATYKFSNLTINTYADSDATGSYAMYFHNTSCEVILDNCIINLWDEGSWCGDGDIGIYYNV
ncbi:MAG: hypothetical protein MIO92_15205, partial [Methanosarcinaceae archaeon]|nr:hypothetical protein [Methanosarcinaceae archaeon]